MGPAPTTFDTMLPSTSSALYNIPKLAEDGTNWITYKERMLTTVSARGLMRYVDGRATLPAPFALDPKTQLPITVKGAAPTDAEIEALDDKIDDYYQKDALVKQHIFSTISDRLLLQVQGLLSASKIWAEIKTIHEGKTELVQVDLRRRLQDTRCNEQGDVRTHFSDLMCMREQLAGMGMVIDERDFYAIALGSLPESYRPLISAISATARITKSPLSTYDLVNVISEEYEHRLLADRGTSKKGANNNALSATANAHNRHGAGNTDTACYNCRTHQ